MKNSRIIQGLMRSTNLSDEALYDLIQFDLENGITIFDLADIYGKGEVEAKLGRIIKLHPELREKMFIQTKCLTRPFSFNSRKAFFISFASIKISGRCNNKESK